MSKATKQSNTETIPYYEEWKVEIKPTKEGPTYEKLKLLRPRVLITEEQAEVLNTGVLNGQNFTHSVVMYFLPENQ